ncbi:MAG TPA: hypothetical protein VHE08_01325 [Solirubrobacterales bacterium]|nr:hypothetical protein [Solirubrobacterales bacterium]
MISAVGRAVGHDGSSPFAEPSATKHPNFLISIYATSCGAPGAELVGEGTAAQLESEAGLALSKDLPPDADTTLFATQTDPESHEESVCSKGIVYQQVTTAPGPPVFTGSSPVSPGEDSTPNLIGTSREGSTVSIFTNPSCSGSPVSVGTAVEFAGKGIVVGVPEGASTVFYAKAELAGFVSGCSSSSLEYRNASQPPPSEEHPGGGGGGEEEPREQLPNPPGRPDPPKLRTAPSGRANDNTPSITGKAPGAAHVAIYEDAGCRGAAVVSGTVGQFASGLALQVADNSTVALYGVSVDGGGDRSACTSEPVEYTEDSIAPHVRFTSGPGAKTRRPKVQFTFADTTGDPSTNFQCRLDKGRWKGCGSPLRLKHLGHRHHLLRVRGVDGAGNVSALAKRRFRVTRHR